MPRCELDVRPGGALRIDMEGPDGTVYLSEGIFEEHDGETLLTLEVEVLEATADAVEHLEGMAEGWSQSFAKLDAFLVSSGGSPRDPSWCLCTRVRTDTSKGPNRETDWLDEYRLTVDPLLLRGGTQLFDRLETGHDLTLLETKAYDSETALLHYRNC